MSRKWVDKIYMDMEMEKIFNTISIALGVVGGIIASLFGGFDKLLIALIIVICIDYFTGLVKAFMGKKLSSTVGFKGLLKKVFIFCIVALSVTIQGLIGENIPVREVVIVFYIVNEGLSILENAGEFLPIPEKLKDILLQLREKKEDKI